MIHKPILSWDARNGQSEADPGTQSYRGDRAALSTFAQTYVADLDRAIECWRHPASVMFGCASVMRRDCSSRSSAPFRATSLTVIVDDLDQVIRAAGQAGAIVSREPADQAVGRNVTMSFPSGPVIEYVEWNLQTRQAVSL